MNHTLYTDADKNRPDVICDRNGQVVLDLCKTCGKAEAELLEQPECIGPRCAGCDLPNGCPEYCWCDAAGAGKAEYASWFPILPRGVNVPLEGRDG